MIRYKKYQVDPNSRGGNAGKWFMRPVIDETYGLTELSKHMSEHNTPFSPGAIKGVLTDMIVCIKELILDGKNVKLDDLAIFSVGIQCKGATSAEELTVANNVKSVKLRARATGALMKTQLNLDATLREINPYTVGTTTTEGAAA